MSLHIFTWAWVCMVLCGRWAAGACVAEGGTSDDHVTEGDAVITQLLSLHHGPQCDQLELTEVQVLEATKLAVQRVNQLGLIPGVTLGVRAMDTCGNAYYAVTQALTAWVADAYRCPPAFTLGFLGPGENVAATAVGSATQTLGTPVMAYGPRLSLAPHTLDLLTPAPQRSAQAAMHVLSGAGVDAISIVHTADAEGKILAEHFITAAEYVYICVEMVLEDGELMGLAQVLEDGPGIVAILGTRHGVQNLARALGAIEDAVDLLLLVDSGGPVPEVELADLETPALILQRIVPHLPEFASFLQRDLEPDDGLRRQYLAYLSECVSCDELDFGYVAAANSAIASVFVYAEALREAQLAHCGGVAGLCDEIKNLDIFAWNDLLSSASLEASATIAFPGLKNANLDPGSEDIPRYTVRLLTNGSLTQVGQADESSAVLGMLELPELRCGTRCPCTYLSPPLLLPPVHNISHASSGFDIIGGAHWWNWEVPSPEKMSKRELTVYFTAFFLLVIIFMSSCSICLYSLNRPPSRQ